MHDPFAGIIQKIKFRRYNLRKIARRYSSDTNDHDQRSMAWQTEARYQTPAHASGITRCFKLP